MKSSQKMGAFYFQDLILKYSIQRYRTKNPGQMVSLKVESSKKNVLFTEYEPKLCMMAIILKDTKNSF